jgi:hypothetical protein
MISKISPYFSRSFLICNSFSKGFNVQVEYITNHHGLHAFMALVTICSCNHTILFIDSSFRRLYAASDLKPVPSPLHGASTSIASKNSGYKFPI